MKTRNLFSKVLAAALAVVMLVGVLPSFAMAAEGDSDSSNLDNLVMNKTAKLEDDGTYTVTLEAYAKGEVKTTTVKQVVPTDVILVLDQSGSMAQQTISGIPGDTYSEANPTNAEVASGGYFYKVGDYYYRVTATKELVSTYTGWVGDDGNPYTADELSYSWTRRSDGQVYYTARPFVTSTLSTWTRSHTNILSLFYYVNDDNGQESTKSTSAANARKNFQNAYAGDGYTVEFHNDGAPSAGDTDADDPYYVAAVYVAVSQQTVNTYRYTYTYVDAMGKVVTIGQSDTGTESEVDSASCSINPLYIQDTVDGYRIDALKYAANRFIDSIYTNAVVNGVDHRVAVVGFASDGDDGNNYYYMNSELFVGATQYNYADGGYNSTYNTTGNLASDHYADAFQSVRDSNGYANLISSIGALAGNGGTHPDVGFDMANGIFGANSNEYTKNDGTTGTRRRIVIFLTDGEPGKSGYDSAAASSALNKIDITKGTYGAKVYTVAVLDSQPTEGGNVDTFLKNSSSSGSYTLATSTADLDGFFQTVDQDISNTETTVSLSENSYVVDRLSDYFVVPEGFSVEENVTLQVAKHTGFESFTSPTPAPSAVTATLSTDSEGSVRGVSVCGFNFVSDGSDGNLVKTDDSGGSITASGNKLVITITGLLAKDAAATGTYIDTNKDVSGIWDMDSDGDYGMIKEFPMPHTLLDKKTFVLDYAKGAQLDVYGATKVDSAQDQLFSKVDDTCTSLSGAYGNVSASDGKLIYNPTTTKWEGYDTFYALGKDSTKGDASTKNIWTKVSVLPANNVYYEDTFVTNVSTGTVGIEFGDNWSTVTAGSNTEDPNGAIQGWIEDLADDTGDSDGTVTKTSSKTATATFTFTGTGFDIYSRTNMTSGKVYAKVSWTDEEGANHNKGLLVDTESASGEYYGIPTLWFNGEYATYTVTIKVQNDAEDGAAYSYCIDGIRIYNPLNPDNIDETVSGAYGDEFGVSFATVRQMLLDAPSLNDGEDYQDVSGFVFIDKLTEEQITEEGDKAGTPTKTNIIGTYEDYGPKNEVYLAPGNAIVFYAGEAQKVQIGLKSPMGTTVTANVSSGSEKAEIVLGHTTDLYYEAVPDSNGYIVISNASADDGGLLSVTKVKFFNNDDVSEVSTMNALAAVDAFDLMPVVAYSLEPEVPVEPEQPTEPEITEPEPTEPEIIIDNPEPDPQPEEPAVQNPIEQLVRNLFETLRGWFRH